MDSPILIWISQVSFIGAAGAIFFSFLIHYFDEIPTDKQNSPKWDATFCGYSVCLCPIKRTPGLYGLRARVDTSRVSVMSHM